MVKQTRDAGLLLVLLAAGFLTAAPVHAQTGMSIAVLVLRGEDGTPMAGARCTLASYAWSVAIGQETRTVADGETDQSGQIAFDVTEWPRANYVVRFSSTNYTRPPTRFAPATTPVEAMFGGQSGRVFFVVDTAGALHLDSSGGTGQPTYTGGGRRGWRGDPCPTAR